MTTAPAEPELYISSLKISGYRALEELSVSPLRRATLITGENNTGKSSFLEALRLYAFNAAPDIVCDIVASRDEDKDIPGRSPDFLGISSLFHGFPRLLDHPAEIQISAEGRKPADALRLRAGYFRYDTFDGKNDLNVGEMDDGVPALFVDLPDRHNEGLVSNRQFLPLAKIAEYVRSPSIVRETWLRGQDTLNCISVGPRLLGGVGSLWDNVVLTEYEQRVVKALSLVDSRIRAVAMAGGGGSDGSRTPIARVEGVPRPVPLRSTGEGLNRVFATALALINARDGLLLIDEVENGLHYTVQRDIWKVLMQLSRDLDVQVFATTHSWDAVRAFRQAISEEQDDGTLVRLSRYEGRVIPTVFQYDDLAAATRHDIELR